LNKSVRQIRVSYCQKNGKPHFVGGGVASPGKFTEPVQRHRACDFQR